MQKNWLRKWIPVLSISYDKIKKGGYKAIVTCIMCLLNALMGDIILMGMYEFKSINILALIVFVITVVMVIIQGIREEKVESKI